MNILLILIPAALALGALGLAAFLWSLRAGQYEDLDGAGERILFDEEPPDNGKRQEPSKGVSPPRA